MLPVHFLAASLSITTLRKCSHPLASAGYSGTCLAAEWEAAGSCVYHNSHGDIQPWAQVAHTYCIARSTQHSTLHGTVKWVSVFIFLLLSNINKWHWWVWMIAAYWQTYKPSQMAWFQGWWPSGAQSTFIKWTGWTLTRISGDNLSRLFTGWIFLLTPINNVKTQKRAESTDASHVISPINWFLRKRPEPHPLCQCFNTSIHWVITELRFYVPLDRKLVKSETFYLVNLDTVLKKLNLTQKPNEQE